MDNSEIQSLFQTLKDNRQTLAVAESATGGMISHIITSSPGASIFYLGSVTSYSPMIKNKLLKVDFRCIETYGIVSSQVATQMAEGVRELFGSTFSISTTGWADGDGDEHEPTGTVWIAISGPYGTKAFKYHTIGNRQENIVAFSKAAIKGLADYIKLPHSSVL